MLSREKRLVKGRDFDRAYQKGKRVSSASFNISFVQNRSQITKIGVVVGKKFSKKATERNRAKRIFREAVRAIYNDICPGFDIVLFVKKTNTQEPKIEVIKTELKKTLEKAGVLK